MKQTIITLSSLIMAAIFALSFPQKAFAEEESNTETEEETTKYEIIYDAEGTVCAYFYENGSLVVSSLAVMKNYSEDNPAPWSEYGEKTTTLVFSTTISATACGSIGSYTFFGFDKLTSVMLPQATKAIKSYAFGNCTSLTTVGCGESLTSISDAAFYNCSSLKELILPNTYYTIGADNFNYTEVPVILASFRGGIAELYTIYSDGEVIFKDITQYAPYSNMYSATKDNVITLANHTSNIGWEYNPYTKTLMVMPKNTDSATLTKYDLTLDALKDLTYNLIIDEKISKIGSETFKDYRKLRSASFSLNVKEIETDAFCGCYNLCELSFYRLDMCEANNIISCCSSKNLNVYCHYSTMDTSTYMYFKNNNVCVRSFEGTERLETIYDDVTCANQFDGISSLSKYSSYVDENGERVYFTQSWNATACVVTSAAMMIERRAYLDGYKAEKGNYDQETVAAIVKEISYSYVLVNYSWLFIWGEHTSSYDTLTKDGNSFEVVTNSYDAYNISEATLKEYLDSHPEGVVCFNNKHAVLVINYITEGDDAGKYTVWDPGTGKEQIRSFRSLNGCGGFVLNHIIYVD